MSLKSLRAGWEQTVLVARKRTQPAVVALITTAMVHGVSVIVFLWQASLLGGAATDQLSPETAKLSDSLVAIVSSSQLVLLLLSAVLFLRWLGATVTAARGLIPPPHLRWTASSAVWGFFLPIVNIVRPYQVMRDLHGLLEPEGVPEPAPRPDPEGAGDYRTVPMKKAPPPGRMPRGSIGAWWALYLLGGAVERAVNGMATLGDDVDALIVNRQLAALSSLVEIVAAVLAVLAVQAIDGRLGERFRRVSYASKAELRAWGIAR